MAAAGAPVDGARAAAAEHGELEAGQRGELASQMPTSSASEHDRNSGGFLSARSSLTSMEPPGPEQTWPPFAAAAVDGARVGAAEHGEHASCRPPSRQGEVDAAARRDNYS